MPDEAEETISDPQILPIHFNFNYMERDNIPLHNEKYSRMNDEYQKRTEVLKHGFFDSTLPTPSHVILNHINSWETMSSIPQGESGASGSSERDPAENTHGTQQMTKEGLTCISMA